MKWLSRSTDPLFCHETVHGRCAPLLAGAAAACLLCLPGGADGKPTRGSRSVERLLSKAKDPLIRESAAQVLGVRGSPAAVPLLEQHLANDENQWVRARCAESLGSIGDPRAIRALDSALSREKDQRVRRSIAGALVRFGQRAGINELMWQLKSGTNHTKAEVMEFLVEITGQPLGQNVDAWWAYLSAKGNIFLARRPKGRPAVLELSGQGSIATSAGPTQSGPTATAPWQLIPAVVINLPAGQRAVTRKTLVDYERRHGPLPGDCLMLINTGWRFAARPPARSRKAGPRVKPAPPTVGVTLEAVQHLLRRSPTIRGVGVDTPTLDPAPPGGRPATDAARRLVTSRGKLVLEGLDQIDRLPESGARLLVLPLSDAAAGKVRVLALLP